MEKRLLRVEQLVSADKRSTIKLSDFKPRSRMLFSRHIYWTTLGHILFILATGTGLWLIISQQGGGNRDITGYLLLVSDWKISE